MKILSAAGAIIVLAYITLSEPFLGIMIVGSKIRIMVEALLLLTFLACWDTTRPVSAWVKPLCGIVIVSLWLILSNPQMTGQHGHSPPALIAKLAMLLAGAYAVRRHQRLYQCIAWTWVGLWSLISVQTILSAVAYNAHLVAFLPIGQSPLAASFKSADFFHPAFGFINTWNFFGTIYGKSMGYLLEPIALGLCLGLNVLAPPRHLPPRLTRVFIALNLVAGICVGSSAFYLFFLLLGVTRVLQRFLQPPASAMIVGAIAIIVLWATSESTSLKDRFFRFAVGIDALMHSDWKSVILGRLNYLPVVSFPNPEAQTISSGFLTVLVQRGLPFFLFLCTLLHRFTRGHSLVLIYLLYYGLLIQFFWWPATILFLVLLVSSPGLAPDIPENCEGPRPSSRRRICRGRIG